MWSYKDMALFKKKQTTTTNIPELQEYYANQQKESTGKAWLLAIGSLLVTIVILVGSFFGGRWVYRKITKKDKPVTTTAQTDTSTSDTTTKTPSTSSSSDSSTTTTAPKPTTTTTTPAQGVATTQSAATNTSATAATTTAKQLTNTGPGNTVALFAGITVVAYLVHRSYLVRKLNK